MSFEDEYAGRPKKKNPLAGLLPFLGLILAVALGAIAWVLSEPVQELVVDNIRDFPADQQGQIIVTGGLWVLLLLFSGLLYTLFAPKPTKLISEKHLKHERDDMYKEQAAKRKRRQQIARKLSKERKQQLKKR
jgi:hypothetical protein